MVDPADTLAVLVREDATAVDLAVAMERLPDKCRSRSDQCATPAYTVPVLTQEGRPVLP